MFSVLFLLLSVPGIISQVIMERRIDVFRRKSAPDSRKFSYYRWVLTDAWPAKDVRMYDLTNAIKKGTMKRTNIEKKIKRWIKRN